MTVRRSDLLSTVVAAATLLALGGSWGCKSGRGLLGDGSAIDTVDKRVDSDGDSSVLDHPAVDQSAQDQDAPAVGPEADASGGDGAAPSPDAATVPQCAEGQHMCPGGCVGNGEPRACGSSCTPCEPVSGGTATCDGTKCGASCPVGTALCNGVCQDVTMSCTPACPVGTHPCNGQCPSNSSVNACGTSCAPCSVPPGATQASCDGQKCDFSCMTGYHRCGASCARDDDATMCGVTCGACPTDANGVAKCLGAACTLTCNTGFHSCSGKCVSNAALANCGPLNCTACQAPTAGSVTCDGLACVPACPTGMKLCSGACIPSNNVCMGVCPSGTHNCSGLCASNTSTASCDTACTPCAVPSNGTATCSSGGCGVACNGGFHLCGSSCVSNLATATCGASCTPCPGQTGGTATCGPSGCGITCDATHPQCGNICCAPPPANAVADCSSTPVCAPRCRTNFHACEGTTNPCYGNTDPAHCGAGCDNCAQPNATPSCNGTGCSNVCLGRTLCAGSNGRPSCGSWSFESGTVEGWTLSSAGNSRNSGGAISASTRFAFEGTRSLALPFNGTGFTAIKARLCSTNQSVSLVGLSVTAHFLLDRSAGNISSNTGSIYDYNGGQLLSTASDFQLQDTGQWFTVQGVFNQSADGTATDVEFSIDITSGWTGTIYVDSIDIRS